MPPGFEWFQPELVTAELRSTTPAWRVRLSRVLATVALALVILSFWWHDFRWESFGTGVLLSLVAVFLIPSRPRPLPEVRSEEHTSELQSLMRSSYAVFCLKKTLHASVTDSISTQHNQMNYIYTTFNKLLSPRHNS